jgi:hypothetical protein
LPDAAVHDISICRAGSLKLLRAAVASRGLWEVDISASPATTKFIYLRVHAHDSRRISPTPLLNPSPALSATDPPPPAWLWYVSPDIRIRPAPLGSTESTPTFPAPMSRYWIWVFQTALRAVDPLCRPNGRRDDVFTACLKRHGGTLNATLWDTVITNAKPNVYANPWGDGTPTEADLFELIVEQGQDYYPTAGPPPISPIQPRKILVDVLVHYRDLRGAKANTVKVTLLQRELPADQTTWPTVAISADWKTKVTQVIGGASPVLGDGWVPADPGPSVGSPSLDVDARMPRVVTFNVDFTGATAGKFYVLLAVVHADADPLTTGTLVGNNLQDLVLSSHQVAVRVVTILT